MNIRMRARLLEKTVIIDGKERKVYGLADFYTKPTRRGIGKYCLRAFEDIAEKDGKYCIIGFCDDRPTLDFYVNNGWWFYGKYENKFMFSNVFIEDVEPTEKW